MIEKRLTHRLTENWERMKGDTPLPVWERFNSAAFADIWEQCCTWRVDGGNTPNPLYTYEYLGKSVKDAFGKDMTGQVFVAGYNQFAGARVVKRIGEVIKTMAPIVDEGQFVNESHKVVKFRSCLLPYGNKHYTVTQVLLGLSWHAF